jgi:hypothetical protein
MRRVLSAVFVVGMLLLVADMASAQMGGMGMGSGAMGPGMMGGGGMGRGGQAGRQTPPQMTQQRAGELAQQYADENLKGYTVERVLPFAGTSGTAYSVELKGPAGQTRTLHVNPWGGVVPFDGSGRRPS